MLATPSGLIGAELDSRTSTARPVPMPEAPTAPRNTLFLISTRAPGPNSPAPTLEFRMFNADGSLRDVTTMTKRGGVRSVSDAGDE